MSPAEVDQAVWRIIGVASLGLVLLFVGLALWRVTVPRLAVRVASSLGFIGFSLASVWAIDAMITRTFPPQGIYVDLGLLHLLLPTVVAGIATVLVTRVVRSRQGRV
jgi:hypothetical protein